MTEKDVRNQEFKMNNEINYAINNIVAMITGEINEKINLLKILTKVTDSKYNPEIFPGLILRIEDPKTTFLIFTSGKIILTGLSHPLFLNRAVTELLSILEISGIVFKNPKFKIVNIVASGDLQFFIDLNKASILMEKVMYEPEVFPALIYRMDDPKAVFLIFSNGKFICTKILDEETLKFAINKLKNYLQELDVAVYDFDSFKSYDNIFL